MNYTMLNLISGIDLEIDLLHNLQDKSIEQKHLYTGEGASIYYLEERKRDSEDALPNYLYAKDYISFFQKNYQLPKESTFALISLGCGNSEKEKPILEWLISQNYKVTYVAVDSSTTMLELSKQKLKEVNCPIQYICADFSADTFKKDFIEQLNIFQSRIFAFFGGTIGNIPPTKIVNSLNNMLSNSDYLWIDIAMCEPKETTKGITNETNGDFGTLGKYCKYTQYKEWLNFIHYPLSRAKIPSSSGKIQVTMHYEPVIGANIFRFSFIVQNKIVTDFRKERIIYLPGEEIKLLDIRTYETDAFKNFMREHYFNLVDEHTVGSDIQFLFQYQNFN